MEGLVKVSGYGVEGLVKVSGYGVEGLVKVSGYGVEGLVTVWKVWLRCGRSWKVWLREVDVTENPEFCSSQRHSPGWRLWTVARTGDTLQDVSISYE